MTWTAGEWTLFGVGAVLYLYWLYQMAVAVHGVRMPTRARPAKEHRRFAVMIPAHDEELVIGQLLESLAAQLYPKDRFGVFVSCDGCTDRTAAIATERGAVVLEREARDATGKTANLRWALGRIPLDAYDAVVIFDADNLVDESFLANMNDYLEAHPDTEAVQGWLDVKNPDDSWVTRVYALAFWYANRFWQAARENARLSVNLGGTGEVLAVSMLRRTGWDWASVTDDLELTCLIVLAGGRVRYNPYAIAFDEKPRTERASHEQRARWLRGHYWALVRFGGSLAKRAFRGGGARAFDLMLHLLIPGRATMSYATMFGGPVLLLARIAMRPSWLVDDRFAWLWLSFAAAGLIQWALVLVVAPSLRIGHPTFRYVPDAFSFFRYGLRSLPAMISSAVGPKQAWSRTEHTRSLRIEEIPGQRKGPKDRTP
jgi:cellulose synthase/poly-beta-1,6-N-acetylglucosamine synthase-like glycosyltransferase